jgi:hypothetical protein
MWPARAGDARVGEDLAAARPGRIDQERSPLAFDGGDFVADGETVFVTPAVARRNAGLGTPEEIAEALEGLLGRRVVLFDDAPDHHAGMFLMTAGNRTVLVGDPSLARGAQIPVGADFTTATQAKFDAVAERCEEEGYRVVRMPVVPGKDGRTWFTWLNAILDVRDGKRIVHMPVFEPAGAMNDTAAAIWEDLGWEVRRVDCTNTYVHYGSLRCLVNVLRRGE